RGPRPDAEPHVVGGDPDIAEVALELELDILIVHDGIRDDLQAAGAPRAVETQRDVGDDVPLGVCAQDGDVLEVDLAPHWDVEAVDPTDELMLEELGAEDCAAADPEAELRALCV